MIEIERFHSLPAEITQFFESSGGHSLVVRGQAGAGKTTFSLEITEYMRNKGMKPYYLSLRVSDPALYRQFPWLERLVMQRRAIQSGKEFLKRAAGGDLEGIMESARKFLRIVFPSSVSRREAAERKELTKLEGVVEAGLVDGEGDFSFDIQGLFPELDDLYEFVDETLPERAFIVVDSVDALSEKYGVGPMRLITAIQRDLVESTGMNVIFVRESSKDDMMDYFGDGVIFLSMGEFEGRRVRVMEIKKLRGQRIENFRYIFTLDNARFRVIMPESSIKKTNVYRGTLFAKAYYPEIIRRGDGEIHDSIFGEEAKKGQLVLLEVGKNVGNELISMFKFNIISSWMKENSTLLWMPMRMESINEFLSLSSEDEINGSIRLITSRQDCEGMGKNLSNIVHFVEGDDIDRELLFSQLIREDESKKPLRFIIDVEKLLRTYKRISQNDLERIIYSWVQGGAHVILSAHSTLKEIEVLRDVADVHLKIGNIHGTSVFYSQKPWSNLYVPLTIGPSNSRKIKFIPLL